MANPKKALLNAVFLILTLIINTLSALGWINGLSTKVVSDSYLTLITPAPFTFGIWLVIYLSLTMLVIMMMIRNNDPYYQKAVDQISILFWLSCLFNIAWIITFSYLLLELSLMFIFGLTMVLSLISVELTRINDKHRFLLPVTIGLYTGWSFIATIVNTAAVLVKLQWQGFNIPTSILSAIALITAIILVAIIDTKFKNAIFPLPSAWAYFGIYQNLSITSEYQLLKITALVGMAILIGIAALRLSNNSFKLIAQNSI